MRKSIKISRREGLIIICLTLRLVARKIRKNKLPYIIPTRKHDKKNIFHISILRLRSMPMFYIGICSPLLIYPSECAGSVVKFVLGSGWKWTPIPRLYNSHKSRPLKLNLQNVRHSEALKLNQKI